MLRKRAEIDKLRAERDSYKAETLIRIQAARREYNDAQATLTPLLSELRQCLISEAPSQTLDDAREATCRQFFSKVIPRFVDYSELHARFEFKEPEKLRTFIDDDVLPELHRFLDWLRVLNLPPLIERLTEHKRGVARIERRSLSPIRRIAEGVGNANHTTYYDRFDQVIDSILAAGGGRDSEAA